MEQQTLVKKCEKCGSEMPGAESWKTMCKKCYAIKMESEGKTKEDAKAFMPAKPTEDNYKNMFEQSVNDILSIFSKKEHEIDFTSEDIRTMINTLFIQRCK